MRYNPLGRTGSGSNDVDLSRARIVAAIDGLPRRLGTDWIDPYRVHGYDAFTRLDETLSAALPRPLRARNRPC